MIFVKQINGNVNVTTDGGDTVLLIQDTGVQISVIGASSDAIQIRQYGYPIYSIAAADVSATQVLPAAAIAFGGNAYDLIDLLVADFFLIDKGLTGFAKEVTQLEVLDSLGHNAIIASLLQQMIDEQIITNRLLTKIYQ